jgi:hypothetical protein
MVGNLAILPLHITYILYNIYHTILLAGELLFGHITCTLPYYLPSFNLDHSEYESAVLLADRHTMPYLDGRAKLLREHLPSTFLMGQC